MKKNDILKDLSNEIFESIDDHDKIASNEFLEEKNSINEVSTDTQEFNFEEFNKVLDSAIIDNQNVGEVDLKNITNNNQEKSKENLSLNDINTIISDHFSDVENEDEAVSFSEMVEEIEDDNDISLSEDLLEEDEDEDITFNDLNNRTQEFNFEELNDDLKTEEDVYEEETKIVSNFPKLDRFGSVFPRKNI